MAADYCVMRSGQLAQECASLLEAAAVCAVMCERTGSALYVVHNRDGYDEDCPDGLTPSERTAVNDALEAAGVL